jgi:hypothetical protein
MREAGKRVMLEWSRPERRPQLYIKVAPRFVPLRYRLRLQWIAPPKPWKTREVRVRRA